jgi:hypothetical protein
MESVNRVARRSNEPGLRRVSQDLNLVRNSIKLARASMGSTGVSAVVGRGAVIKLHVCVCVSPECCMVLPGFLLPAGDSGFIAVDTVWYFPFDLPVALR